MIVIAGCSHVFGSDLDDVAYPHPSKQVWPQLVADELQEDSVNVSLIAGGNQAIARRSIITIYDLMHNRGINPKDITLLVQFSYFNRHELFHPDFQFCGPDFPYVTSKFLADDLIPNSANILNIIKHWMLGTSDAYTYITSVQAIAMLHLWAARLGVKMHAAYTEAPPELELPEWGTTGNSKIGYSDFDDAMAGVAGDRFATHDSSGIRAYKLNHHGMAFDPYTTVLSNMIYDFDSRLMFGQSPDWVDFCETGGFNQKKRMWEQGDKGFRAFDKIRKIAGGERYGNGHWDEEAHAAAAKLVLPQLA